MATIDMATYSYSLELNDESFSRGLRNADEGMGRTGGKGKKLGKAMKVAGGAMAAGIGAGVVAVTGLLSKTLETTAEINKFSQVTGMTTDEFQKWDTVMKNNGYSMEQASGDLAALGEKAMDAANGAGEGAELFGKLGVQVTDSTGKLKSQEEIFNETITALQGMEDVTERNAIASALLSTTGEELVPVLNMTTEELQNMKDNANVISEDDLQKAEEFKAGWDNVKDTFNNLLLKLGVELLPMFTSLFEWIQEHMPQIKEVTKQVFDKISEVVTILVDNFNTYLLPIFQDMKDWVVEHLPEIQAQFENTFALITELIEAALDFIMKYWNIFGDNIMNYIKTTFDTVVKIIDDAFLIIEGLLDFFIGLFTGDWERMGEGIEKIWDGLWGAIGDILSGAWGILSGAFDDLWDDISDWFSDLKDDAKKWGKNMISGFVDGIFAKIDSVSSAAATVASKIGDFIGFNSPSKKGEGRNIVKWGRNMIDGFLEGAEAMIPNAELVMNNVVSVMKPQETPQGASNNGNAKTNPMEFNITNNFPNVPLSPSEMNRKQEQSMRGMALKWGFGS
ncbi:hypothetical protein WAK64_20695 [Bacillus spongiae]|uniref:Phage tail tape measure protein n=1 Tax=Bacillus spongiae TaxID=2683610 RepID=A0ABU8HJR2_9BACI